jgi:uncharacterized protein
MEIIMFQIFKSDQDNQWYWRLRANNHEIVAVGGEGYSSKQNCLRGIMAVRSLIPDALIGDLSIPGRPALIDPRFR